MPNLSLIFPALLIVLPLLAAAAAGLVQRLVRVRLGLILGCLALSLTVVALAPVEAPIPIFGGVSVTLTLLNRLLLVVLHVIIAALVVAGWQNSGPFLAYVLLTFTAAASSLNVDSPFVAVLLLQIAALIAVLVLMESPQPDAAEGISRYLTLTFLAGVFLLVGLILVEGSRASAENRALAQALTAILVLGFALKLAAPPLHLWIGEIARGARPLGVAIVVAVINLATIGLVARLFATYPAVLLDERSRSLLSIAAGVALALSVLLLIAQRDLNRLLGFAASYTVAFSLFGIALATSAGLVGAVLHAIGSALALALIAVSATTIERAAGTTQIADLAGVARALPFSSAGLLVGALGLAGLPPFLNFTSFWILLDSAARRGPGWAGLLLVCAAIAMGYFAVVAQRLLFGTRPHAERLREPWSTRAAIATLAGLLFVLGILPQPLVNALLEAVARFPLGRV